jgi:hypothetical protein
LTKLAQARLNKLQETTSNGQQYWLGTLASGKIIAISDTPLPPTVNCNFQLTFEELHAAQLACNILGLTSLTLVKEKKND